MFALDPFQRRAIAAIDRGTSVLVAAPTGAGKTLVAEHAVERSLARGRKAFYTTPLKALSNQKFRDLAARFGDERVGLITGDRTVRPDADLVVMTTEVLRALLYERAPLLDGLDAVVLDEFHYLQDPDRGPVWEEVVVHSPHDVLLVCLSATLADPQVLHDWLNRTHGPTELVVEEQRPVSLHFLYAIGNLQRTNPLVVPMFVDGRLNSMAELRDGVRRVERGTGLRERDRSRPVRPEREDLLGYLRDGSMLPAIWFVLSRSGCDRAVAECVASGVRLTTDEETAEIAKLVATATEGLSVADSIALDATGWRLALACGVAAHHGGMAPIQREVVELAASAGLVKVVFATETLALGVNLPARTVVIDSVMRGRGDTLTGAEFAQLAGRAGRRGLDAVGYVVVPWAPDVAFHRVAGLAGGRTEPLRSWFRATPAMAANLVRTYGVDDGRERFARSLAHHIARADVAGLRSALADRVREREELADGDDGDGDGDGDAGGEQRRTVAAVPAAAIESLRVGDVVVDPGRPSRSQLLVIAPPRVRRGEAAVDVVAGDARRLTLIASELRDVPVVVGHVDLSDLAPGVRGYARAAAALLAGRASTFGAVAVTAPPARRSSASAAARRLDEEIARLSARVAAVEGALDDELEVMFDLLRRRGHLSPDGWTLTQSGSIVRRLFHERGLLVGECLAAGLFDGLDAPSMAALLSAFRASGVAGRDWGTSPFPSRSVRERWAVVESLSASLQRSEADAGLDPSRSPDTSLLTPIHRWASGLGITESRAGSELGPGDLAREVRQIVELGEQVAAVAYEGVASVVLEAMATMSRGLVVASAFDGPLGGAGGFRLRPSEVLDPPLEEVADSFQ